MLCTDHPNEPEVPDADGKGGDDDDNGDDDDDDNQGAVGGSATVNQPAVGRFQRQPKQEPKQGDGRQAEMNEQADAIAAKFLNRARGWQNRINTSKTVIPPPESVVPPKTIKKEVPKVRVTKATTAVVTRAATREQENEAISRILKLVK